MINTKIRYYGEEMFQPVLATDIRYMRHKIDQIAETQSQLMTMVRKLLASRQGQSVAQTPSQFPLQKLFQEYQKRPFINSDFQNSALNVQAEQSALNFSQHNLHDQEDSYEFMQRVEEQSAEDENIPLPLRFQQEQMKYQTLLSTRRQNGQKIQLAYPQKILHSLQSQFQKMNLTFSTCQCLFAYPQMVNQSFYQKITDNNNIVFLGLLKNQEVVGAFTEIGFSSKINLIPKDNPRCCLFNLNKKHFLYAQRTNKTHSCDKSYILFGNWQIKLKIGENVMFSDLGGRGDCFKKLGYGANQRQVANTRQWIFGQASSQQSYQLQKYMICALK